MEMKFHMSTHIDWDADAAQKGGYAHFMMKEMFEGLRLLRQLLIRELKMVRYFLSIPMDKDFLSKIKNINFVACGTAYHAIV